jgi:hypothetical protein
VSEEANINLLKMERMCVREEFGAYRTANTLHLGHKIQSVNVV